MDERGRDDFMEFDYSRLKHQISEEQLEEVYQYMSENKENIVKLIQESDQYLIPIPTHVIFKDKNEFLIQEYQTFSFTKDENEKVYLELLK